MGLLPYIFFPLQGFNDAQYQSGSGSGGKLEKEGESRELTVSRELDTPQLPGSRGNRNSAHARCFRPRRSLRCHPQLQVETLLSFREDSPRG
jgi:hypothetical protein